MRAASFLVGASLVGLASIALPDPIVGPARVIDGDTIRIGRERIRLYGIDAPELSQRCEVGECGYISANFLAEMTRGRTVECVGRGHDHFRRVVAICSVGGNDLGEAMVRAGWAIEYPRYSDGRYGTAQAEAKAARAGMWKGWFQPPWTYRQEHRQ